MIYRTFGRTRAQIAKTAKLRFLATSTAMTNPIVTVKEGRLRGAINNLLDGSKYYSFKGIRYAQPPVGKLRFKAPLPPRPWTGVLDAIEHGPICPQKHLITRESIESNEDCLFLNVYTRSLQPDSKIPVMVFIHGGGFLSGSGETEMYGPEFLLQHDVVLVTINYRLEAFGFLCLDIPEVPGNAGLRDQAAALHWVQNNITQFGGDPNNVTLFGESAGGASVTFHMLSPMSKGLFHKAISQSGTFLSDWSLQADARERAFRVGKYLGKDTKDPYELLKFLQSVPHNKLIGVTFKVMTDAEKLVKLPMIFTPVVEKVFSNSYAFLTEKPLDMLVSGKINKIPLVVGYTSAEGLLFILPESKNLEIKNKSPSYFLPKELVEKLSEEKIAEFGSRLKQFYFGNKEITTDDTETLSKLLSDRYIIHATQRFAHFYAEFCESTYVYTWNLDTDLNFIKKLMGHEVPGACHADDLFHLFYNKMNSAQYNEQKKLRDYVYMTTKLWTDFAKTGNPTPDNRWNIKWKPYTKSNKEYLRIDDPLYMGEDDEKERFEFWNKLFIEAGLAAVFKSNL